MIVTIGEIQKYAEWPDALLLLAFLRSRHGLRDVGITLPTKAMAASEEVGNWDRKRYMRARNRLIEGGELRLDLPGGGRGNCNLYTMFGLPLALMASLSAHLAGAPAENQRRAA